MFALQYIVNILFIIFTIVWFTEMELELELLTNEKDEIQVIQKVMDLAKKAKELGFSIKELELETEEDDDEEKEETEKEE